MRKLLLSVLCTTGLIFWLSLNAAFGQITVSVTGGGNTTPNLDATYNSFSDALAAMNAVTAMTGPVTFSLSANSTEVAPQTGFTIGSATLNPLLNSTNTLTIVKGGGTVTLLAGVGDTIPNSYSPDGILKIVGADYVTIDGLTLSDTNTVNPNTMEFGIALFKLSTADGAQYNTIKNCTINMQRINNAGGSGPMVDGSVGILVINAIPTAAKIALTPTAASGSNSYNLIYSNLINGGNIGIALSGYLATTPFTLGDTGNDIGGNSTGQGNTVLNYGGGGTTSPAAGIRANHQWGVNISYNIINNNNGSGVNHATTLRGIYAQAGVSANATLKYNQITIHGGATTSQTAAIENAIGSTAASNTVLIDHNTITGDYLTATTGVFYGIYNTATAANVNITYNTLSNINYSDAALAGSGSVYPIYQSGSATNVLVDHNVVDSITRTGSTGGTLVGIYIAGGTNQTATYNTVKRLTINGTGTSGTLYGIQTTTGTIVVNYNEVYTLKNNKGTGTGVIYGIYNVASPTIENVNYNTVHHLAHSGTSAGATYGIYFNTVTGTRTMSYNTVYSISSQGTTVAGIVNTTSSPNIFKNKIYDISSSNAGSTTVSGLSVTSLGTAGSANVYNNIIGNLRAPAANISAATAPAIRGINITVTTASTSLNVLYNTVFMEATSTGVNFGTAGIYVTANATATTANLTLRNNLIDNESQCFGTGVTAAYQRSTADLANFNTASNYNLYYAGPPTDSTVIFFNGTTAYSTLADYKTVVGPTRETVAISLNPVFINVPESDPNYLHFSPGVPSGVESGGVAVTGYNDDYDGNTRQGSAGYTGTGTAPDIGADEFEGLPAFTCVQPNPGNTLASNDTICLGETITLSLANPPAGTGNNYQWRYSADNGTYTDIPGANLVTYTFAPSAAGYFKCFISCSQDPPLTGSSNPILISFYNNVTSTTPASRCGIGTVNLLAEGNGGSTLKWYTALTGGLPVGSGSPFVTPELTATTNYYVGAETYSIGTATIGAGATTSATYSNPFYSAYSNIHTQHLIRASELNAAGLAAGNLLSIALDVTSAGTLPMLDLSIKIGHTTATTMSAFLSPAFTTVYTNASLLPVVGVNVLTFSTPFTWDGVSNIVVEFCHGNPTSTATMSRTVKADNTSYVSTIKVHNTTASSSATICGNTTSNLVTYSLRPQFKFEGALVCSSPRKEVVATVTPPPALTVTAGQTICNNSVMTLEVTSTLGDFNTYIWSPTTGLFNDPDCESAYTSGNASTVYFKSTTPGVYTFICTGTETGTPCVNKDTVVVTNLPADIAVTASPENHCLNGSSTLTINPSTGYGTATLQWQDSPDNITFTDISGANSNSYTTPTLTSSRYYRMLVKLGATTCTITDTSEVFVNTPQITNTVPGTRCGIGTVTLQATGTGGTLNWYTALTGGTLAGTGSPFVTPVLSTTTTYYVSENVGGTTYQTIPGDGGWNHFTTTGAFQTTTITSAYMILTVLQPITLASMDIYPSATLGTAFSIEARTGSASGTTFKTYAGTTTVVNSGTPSVAQTVNVNWALPIGTYYIGFISNPNTWRSGSVTHNLPWVLPGMVSMDFYLTPSYQYYFYNLIVGSGCESARTAVVATVTPPPDLTLTADQTVCSDEVATIQVTIPDLDSFDIYSWSPDTLLFTDLACTNAYITGNSASTVYAKSTNAVSKTYTCTATKNSTGCVNIKQTVLTVLSPNPTLTASPAEICQAGKVTLSLSPATGWGQASFKWQDSRDGVAYSDIPGVNTPAYTSDTIRVTTYYKVHITNSAGDTCTTLLTTVIVNDQKITDTTPATRCGIGTVTLEATCSGGTIYWYDALTGGNQVGTGSPFITPVISSTTSFYAAAEVIAGGTATVGSGSTTTATYSNPFYSLYSNLHTQHLITAGDLIAGGLRAGNILSVSLYVTSAGTLPMIDLSVKIATTAATSMAAFVSPVWTPVFSSASFMPVVGLNKLTFNAPFYWDGTSNIVMEFCHGNPSSTATMSRTVRANTTTYVSVIKTHSTTAASSATICGNTTSNVLTYSTRPQYFFEGQATCSSPRVQVVATVGDPPAITTSGNKTVCPGEPASIYLTSTLLDFDTYVWTPETNLFLDAAGTQPYLPGTDTSQVYCISSTGGTFTYTCTGSNLTTECVNTVDAVITVLPEDPEITSSPVAICVLGDATLKLSPITGWGAATFQWQDSPDGITWNDIIGATSQNYTTDTINDTMYYKVIIKSGSGLTCSSPEYQLDVTNPQLASTTPGERCGTGTVTLGATGSGGVINWYATSAGGTSIGTGPSFTTPVISTTTSYWVGVLSNASSFASVGPVDNTMGAGDNQALTHYLKFNVLVPTMKLVGVHVYPGAAGNVSLHISTSAGTVLKTISYPVTSGDVGKKTYIPINFDISAGTDYRIGWYSGGVSLFRNSAGAVYPYTYPNVVSITGNSFSTSYYYYCYDWVVTGGPCITPLTEVVATVIPAPAITITADPTTLCQGESATIEVTSSNLTYNYTWEPGTLIGPSHVVTPPYTTSYTVSANDPGTGCVNSGSITVTVNPEPLITITPPSATINGGEVQQLTANYYTTYDNGPIITSYSTGAGGKDESWLLSPLTNYGYGMQYSAGNSVADDFVIANDNSIITTLEVLGYQTSSGTTSPFTGLYVRIWDGNPILPGSTVVWGDITTNRYASSAFANIYRVNAAANADRPVMKIVANTPGLILDAGTYWVEFSAAGNGALTGPWIPPITITGQPVTGNAMQLTGGTTWDTLYDGTYQQGVPFVLKGVNGMAITWSPATYLFLDADATIPYEPDVIANPVWTKPPVTTTYTATATSAASCVSTEDVTVTVIGEAKILNLKLFLEGLYAGAGTLNQAYDEYGPHFGPGVADQVVIELHNELNYSLIEYSSGLVDLSTSGDVTFLTPANIYNSYWITVKHRNHILTVSGAPVSFAVGPVSYDFTTAASQAFMDNQREVSIGEFAIWGGDINKDGIVDSGDMNPVDNASTAITFGYVPEDINGDGIVDSGDMNYVDNNATAIIIAWTP